MYEPEEATLAAGIDCTAIIESVTESVTEKLSTYHKKTEMDIQNLAKIVSDLSQMMQGKVTHPSQAGSSSSQGINAYSALPNRQNALEARHTTDLNVDGKTRSDDVTSLHPSHHVSDLWIQDGRSKQASSAVESAVDSTHSETMDSEQEFWQTSMEDYQSFDSDYGPEISSSISSAAKAMWERPLSEMAEKTKIEEAKTPRNCDYLTTKRVNPEIYTGLPTSIRTNEVKLQKLQKYLSSSITMVLKAASDLTEITQKLSQVKKASDKDKISFIKEFNLSAPMNSLKNAVALGGKTNQQINKFRREAIKPTLPLKYRKLTDLADEADSLLFGDYLNKNIESISEINKVQEKLVATKAAENFQNKTFKQSFQTKRKNSYYQNTNSGNYGPSSKFPKRSNNQGQKSYPSYQQYQQPQKQYNNRENKTYKRPNQETKRKTKR